MRSGDSFEVPLIDAKSLLGLLPAGFPAAASTLEGFRRFLADAFGRHAAGEAFADSCAQPKLACNSRQDGRDSFTMNITLTLGSGDYALCLPVTLVWRYVDCLRSRCRLDAVPFCCTFYYYWCLAALRRSRD